MSQQSAADRAAQPLEPDTQVTTAVEITFSSFSTFRPSTVHVVGQGFSGSPSFGILSTYPPILCGLATFTQRRALL